MKEGKFYGRVENAFFLQEKIVLGGYLGFFFGVGSADFIFVGARIFLNFTFYILCTSYVSDGKVWAASIEQGKRPIETWCCLALMIDSPIGRVGACSL